jgi:acetyl esterase/lipase
VLVLLLLLLLLLLLQGMWHVFQATPHVPEAQQAAQEMADFFKQHLK